MKALRGTELKRFIRKLERPDVDLVFVLADVEDPINVGSIFRVADAADVTKMILAGITPQPPHRLIAKSGRNKDKRVKWEHVPDAVAALDSLRAAGYTCIALELTDDARLYDETDYPRKVALVVGHEDHGVTKRALAACDFAIFLPMHGKGASLNVAMSLGIAAYHVLHAGKT